MLRLTWSPRLWCLSLFGVLMCACSQTAPATQVLVLVSAETDQLASELSALNARLFPVGATEDSEAIEDHPFTLSAGGGKLTLPLSFGIQKVKAERFLLVINGYRKDQVGPVIEQKVIASFLERQTVLIEIVLSSACYALVNPCSSLELTCYAQSSGEVEAGSCGRIPEAVMRPISPGQEFDAAMGLGGAGMDRDSGSELDSAGDDMDASAIEDADSGAPDAEPSDGALAPATAALGRSGAPCETPDALACDRHDGRQKLVCFKGEWSPNCYRAA